MKDTISVVIPAYNIAPYLDRCLESVTWQSYSNLEIIVVNDGSQDDTGAKIDAWAEKDSRIRAIHKENGGVTAARLTGVAAATGSWVGFVDGDDVIDGDMYERLLKNALDCKADISHCGYKMVFPSRVDYYYNTGCHMVHDRQDGLTALLSGTQIEPGLVNKLFRRELFDRLLKEALMDTTIKNNEDLLMNFFLFREAECSVYEDWCPYHYMVRTGSATSAKISEQKLTDPIKVVQRILQETEGQPQLQDILHQKQMRQWISLSSMVDGENGDVIRPVRKWARRALRKNVLPFCRGNAGSKLKIMALWTAIWPWSYGAAHRMYARITGLDRIYEVS